MGKLLTPIITDFTGSPKQFPEYFEPLETSETFEPFPVFDLEVDLDIMASSASSEPSPQSPLPINKTLEQVVRTPSRQPSPQPTHFSVPYQHGNGMNGNGGNGHRILRSATVGYIAPEFKGKKEQMVQGQSYFISGGVEDILHWLHN